ncbi:transmembrane protein, putative [Medicago truncatula]|uniref:Transmembrane protein, putative n=1 Tax=Medicago truncatula TaxID=3880 RepID=G7JVU4_MEDTR|nr:transmembrane protein, putative [Medicago truncatula]
MGRRRAGVVVGCLVSARIAGAIFVIGLWNLRVGYVRIDGLRIRGTETNDKKDGAETNSIENIGCWNCTKNMIDGEKDEGHDGKDLDICYDLSKKRAQRAHPCVFASILLISFWKMKN